MLPKTKARIVALLQMGVTGLLITGIWLALPARWWPVDWVGSLLAAVSSLSAVGLLLNQGWGWSLARAASWLSLAVGLLVVSLLALTAAYLSGLYGPIGGGGALILGAIAVAILPYLIGLPLIQLILLRHL
jgi:hypothetical protein